MDVRKLKLYHVIKALILSIYKYDIEVLVLLLFRQIEY